MRRQRDDERAVAAWVTAAPARRERSAEALGFGPLYKPATPAEAATARVWYGIGALGNRSGMALIRLLDALSPTTGDVMAEAGVGANAMEAFVNGLIGGNAAAPMQPAIAAIAQAWTTAEFRLQSAAASTVAGALYEPPVSEATTAAVFYHLGGATMARADARGRFMRVLTGLEAPPAPTMPMTDGNAAINPWVVSLNFSGPALTMEVIPPAPGGVLKGRDGRNYRVRSMAALASAINAQAVAPRVDIDHQSERVSPTFTGSTRAEGWLSNVRVNARGGLNADFEMSERAASAIVRGEYRYLSPALIHTSDMEVTGLSSVALVNDPNFDLRARAA